MRIRNFIVWSALASIGFAAQVPAVTHGLARARSVYAAADVDGNSRLTLPELRDRQITVSEGEFRDEDADRDGAWSREEFTVHFRAALARSGERPAADLEAEVVRILALRRARTVDETRGTYGPAAGRLAGPIDEHQGATPEIVALDARLERALADLEDRAAGRGAVRGDFDRVRGLWNERLTLVRSLAGPSAGATDPSARFLRALDALEARARAGSVARAEFGELRSVWGARPRRMVTAQVPVAKGPDEAGPGNSVAARGIEVRFERALSELEAKVFARIATRLDWIELHDLIPDRARTLVQGASSELPGAADPRVVSTVAELREALDRMQQRAGAGSIARSDFHELRSRLTPTKVKEPGPSDRNARQ